MGKRVLLLIVGIAAFAVGQIRVVPQSGEALSFNGTTAALNINASAALNNSAADADCLHPLGFPVSGHEVVTCPSDGTASGTPGLRNRFEFEDGSMLAEPISLTYTSGLINTPPTVGGSGSGFDVTVGDIVADIDLFCDGAADRLAQSNISKAVDPGFTAVVDAGPNTGSGNYPEYGYTKNLITGIVLGGGIPITLPNPVTLGFTTYAPGWAGVDANTHATRITLGGDPNPPSLPLCLQSPFRATLNSPGTCPAGVPPITACGYNPYTNPATDRVLFWEIFIAEPDYQDGLRQIGPTGGTNERSGVAVTAGVLRNVQCLEIAGGSTCPADSTAAGTAGVCNDGGLWEDTDSDGLPDIVEGAWGTDCLKIDSDTLCQGGGVFVGDGMTDFEEMAAMSNPLDIDTDGDATSCTGGNRTDSSDNCPNKANTNQGDTDNDGFGDSCDTDDDGDGILDDAETLGIYVGYVNDVNPDPVFATGGMQCRPWAEISAGTSYGISAAKAADIKITLNPLDFDTDNDGIVDGVECSLGSAPGDDAGTNISGSASTTALDSVCLGVMNGVGTTCTVSTKFGGDAPGTVNVLAATAAASRPELQDSAVADDDGDGNANNMSDADADGLPASHERSERTICVRIATGSYGKALFSNCDDTVYPGVFNNDIDGDAFGGGMVDNDPNADCNSAWVSPNTCTGTNMCVWTAAAGYTADTFSTGASGGAGCDGPEYLLGGSPQSGNDDGDGIAVIKSTAASPHGANRVTSYGGGGAIGACTTGEEAANGTNPIAPRDFFDVNNSGKVDAVDAGLVRGAFNAVAGISLLYKRTLDVNNANAAVTSGGRGSGKIDAVDVGLVRGQFNKTCLIGGDGGGDGGPGTVPTPPAPTDTPPPPLTITVTNTFTPTNTRTNTPTPTNTPTATNTPSPGSGAPVVLMGIDAEDGGPGGHGPTANYVSIANSILGGVSNGGTNILVIGGGKSPTDNVTLFWDAVDAGIPAHSVVYVNGGSNISAQSFAGYAMIAVVSTFVETPSGGLTLAENDALATKQGEIAQFVNGGGGLLGFSQTGLTGPYAYFSGIGSITINGGLSYTNISPTAAGLAIGITDAFDVCCWHDDYLTYPSFLGVLATDVGTTKPAAIGGNPVVVPPIVSLLPQTASNSVGSTHTVTATVTDEGAPVDQATVSFSLLAGSANSGAVFTCIPSNCKTNASGTVQAYYTGAATGNDTIRATYLTSSSTATKTWVAVPHIGTMFAVAGGSSGDGLPPLSAAFRGVHGLDIDSSDNVYVADMEGCRVYRISSGVTTLVAGTGTCGYGGDAGPATGAMLDWPADTALDGSGNLYVADRNNCRVRKVTPAGTITTFAGTGACASGGDGGSASSAQLKEPIDVLVSGSDVLIAEYSGCRIRRVDVANNISTFAGTGTCGYNGDGGLATSAHLNFPRRLAKDGSGNIYIADSGNCAVRRVTAGTISNFAGTPTSCGFGGDGGAATSAQLDAPTAVDVDGVGNLYISEFYNCRVRIVTAGTINTFAGNGTCGFAGDGGAASSAQVNRPQGLAHDSTNRIYIADKDNFRIRRVASATITTFGGTGLPSFCGDGFVAITQSCLDSPGDVVADAAGNIYIADRDNHRVRRVSPGGIITTIAGKTDPTSCGAGMGDGGLSVNACLRAPEHLAIIAVSGQTFLFVSDRDDHRIRRIIDPHTAGASIDTVAGNGTAAGAACAGGADAPAGDPCLNTPTGIAVQQHAGSASVYLFVAHSASGGIVSRVSNVVSGVRLIRTVLSEAGTDVSISPVDKALYVAQPVSNQVRRVAATGGTYADLVEGDIAESISTVASGLTAARGIHVDGHSLTHHLLIADTGSHTLKVMTPATGGGIGTFAGGGPPTPGFCGDGGSSLTACMNSPSDIFFEESTESLYFADQANDRVRKVPADQDGDGILDIVEDPDRDGYDIGSETDEADTDTDGDGCADSEENGSNPVFGGMRNNRLDGLGQYDFYDVNGTKKVDAVDIGLVRARFNAEPPNPLYDAIYDRSPGAATWAPGPPNAVINAVDIGLVRAEFNHSCTAAP